MFNSSFTKRPNFLGNLGCRRSPRTLLQSLSLFLVPFFVRQCTYHKRICQLSTHSSQIWSPATVSDPLSSDEMLSHHPFNNTESHNLRPRSQCNSSDCSSLPLSQTSEHIKVSLSSQQLGQADEAKGQKRSERQIEEKCKHNREEYAESWCVSVLWSVMIHSPCFHLPGPPQGISEHQPKHVL